MGELGRRNRFFSGFAFFHEWSRLLAVFGGLAHRSLTDVQGEHLRLFGVNARGIPCPPYESAHMDAGSQNAGWVQAQLQREYATCGLVTSSSLNEPPDHVAVELEFMAFLCSQEAKAWEADALEAGARALQREKGFLAQHLVCWLPGFAEQVVGADILGVYGTIASTARAFVTHDLDLVGILLDRLGGVAPLGTGRT